MTSVLEMLSQFDSSMRIRLVIGILLLFSLGNLPISSQVPSSPPVLGKMVDVGGYRIHLYCTGKGSPTVLITGAAYSFDWALVQPTVSEFTQVCTYDRSGVAWSDLGPPDSCPLRVKELHAALEASGVMGPFVVVGHSLGALVARFYAKEFPADTQGMVFVDHARPYIFRQMPDPIARPLFGGSQTASIQPMISTGLATPHDATDVVFRKLPADDYALHRWADSLPNHNAVMAGNVKLVTDCSSELDKLSHGQPTPLGNIPLIALGAGPVADDVAHLSTDERTQVVTGSSHFIMIDQPESVVAAIKEVVEAVRNKQPLPK